MKQRRKKHSVRNVKIRGNTIRETMDGKSCFDFIKYPARVPMVGHYKRKQPVVLVDRKISDPKMRKSIAMHEATERHLRFHEGITKKVAHDISERKEHSFAKSLGLSWGKEGRAVEKVFRKNARPGQRRKR